MPYTIMHLMMKDVYANVSALGAELEVTDSAKERILEKAYNPRFGARPIRREIQKSIEDPLSEIILSYENISGETILVDTDGDEIKVSI